MRVTAAGIDRIKIGNADASGQGAHFVVWLYLQVDEGVHRPVRNWWCRCRTTRG
ncbi:hypothetical protein [Mesorhizobium sp. M8A.F.Ca.ET.057.01.1.1]|uniref:hypothetical protein n=1 Tax=Mesorhizobium sp. M8A.F.Ca.ET.057.01.1.1 TaxID=2493679 RepID=UPI001ABFB1F2|nr:hypothetical protein [Mesorhizobium sp. M8A.F.Ca.ET.057.01.1.1]